MMEQSLDYILHKFPDYKRRISELFYKYENFRNLLDDLLFTVRKLEECRVATQMNWEVESEYLQAYQDLECEFIAFLNKTDR